MSRDRHGSEHRFEYPSAESITPALVRALASVHDVRPTEVPRVGEAVPCDALERLLDEGDDVTVTFSVGECRVTVRDDGRFSVRTPE